MPGPGRYTMLIIGCLLLVITPLTALAEMSCSDAAQAINRQLRSAIDADELTAILHVLNSSRNSKLPTKFVTKRQARKEGWRPGQDLWKINALQGKSIGGDRFYDREKRLPPANGLWHEADLGYRGGHRGANRLIYSTDGKRLVTVDHYRTFKEIPACR